MSTGVAMAKKKPSTKRADDEPSRFSTLVRLAPDVVADAKAVAALRDTSMAELLSDLLRPLLRQQLEDELRKRVESRK